MPTAATIDAPTSTATWQPVTTEVVEQALDMMRCGGSVRSAAEQLGVAHRTLADALESDNWAARYTRAMVERAAYYAEKVAELADMAAQSATAKGEDKADANLIRSASDNYKWIAGRMDPGRWGDRLQVDQRVTATVVHVDLAKVAKLAGAGDDQLTQALAIIADRMLDQQSDPPPQPRQLVESSAVDLST